MLASVFGKKRLKQVTHPRRAPSPPSPASFASPELGDSSFSSDQDASLLDGTGNRGVHVPLQLDFQKRESISDWFPPGLLKAENTLTSIPERNVSLPGASSSRTDLTKQVGKSDTRNLILDDVIVIAAEGSQQQEIPPSPEHPDKKAQLAPESVQPPRSREPSPSGAVRRPVPNPIQIPHNPHTTRVRVHRSPSVGALTAPQFRSGKDSNAPSRNASRPNSSYSDDISSAVSGTTLAREMLAEFTFGAGGVRDSRFRQTLTRQDSATLPKGERFRSSSYWKNRRISNGEIVTSPEYALDSPVPPIPPIPSSAELSALASGTSLRSARRRHSIVGIESVVSTDALDSGNLADSEDVMKPRRSGSLTQVSREIHQIKRLSRVSRISEGSSPAPSPAPSSKSHSVHQTSGLNDSSASSVYADADTSVESGHCDEPRGPLTDSTSTPDLFSPDAPTTGSASVYSHTTNSTDNRSYSTQATSVKSPATGPLSSDSRVDQARSKAAGSRSDSQPRPIVTLPFGDRPHSVQVPYTAGPLTSRLSEDSMNSSRLPFRPPPPLGRSPVESPDILDMMFAQGNVVGRAPSSRSGSRHAPLIFSPESMTTTIEFSSSSGSPSTTSAAQQTFPETPYAFTPYTAAGFNPPPIPSNGFSPRFGSLNRGENRPALSQRQVFGRVSVAVVTSSRPGHHPPGSPPPTSAAGSVHSIASDPGHQFATDTSGLRSAQHTLAAIEERSAPSTPMVPFPEARVQSRDDSPAPSRVEPIPEGSVSETTSSLANATESSPSVYSHRNSRAVSNPELSRPSSLVPSKRSLSSLPPPSPSPSPAPSGSIKRISPSTSQLSHAGELMQILSESPPGTNSELPPYMERGPDQTALQPPPPIQVPQADPSPPSSPFRAPPPYRSGTPEQSLSRFQRNRPAAPLGPRRPSGPTTLLAAAAGRARAASNASNASNASLSLYSNIIHATPPRQSSVPLSASTPRFQTTPVRFRGLTMEAAQWTFTSHELQSIVSTSIKESADATAIRLLPVNVLTGELPQEVERLEALSAELRMEYKVQVRRRRQRMDDLKAVVPSEISDGVAISRILEEMSEISDNLDHLADELYTVTDQLMQLKHLKDLHSTSALAMALRKLNTSLVKHMADNKNLREQVRILEADRDEGWTKAQELAAELEQLNDKISDSSVSTPLSSRDNSRHVSLARKTSLRAAKAGLRSPSRHRSQRSSVASSLNRSSLASASPALRSSGNDMIPPVPRLPIRTPLGIVTSDLPSRSSGALSEISPTSEARAMMEAQKEVMDMLGISMDTLQSPDALGSPRSHRKQRSLSAIISTPTSAPTSAKHTSEILSPQYRGLDIPDRSAVLATIGMTSHAF
ncbi:hypothetical protein K474DRAFT_1677001 [Panus rudis PR-1116 ss-1]|nr:hypothetical protein K474DRAFT_1677001 [Panus rudis PR-1116 ss-1]